MARPFRLLTVGHGTASASELADLLRSANVEHVADIRSFPGSRRHPHFRREEMELWLPEAGIAYGWERDLGGFRKPVGDSANIGLRNDAFRGYADHMTTPEWKQALHRVLDDAAASTVAVMCSESLWWRCHRRLLSDAVVLLHGVPVFHIGHDGRLAPHVVTDVARVGQPGLVVYDGGQARLVDTS